MAHHLLVDLQSMHLEGLMQAKTLEVMTGTWQVDASRAAMQGTPTAAPSVDPFENWTFLPYLLS